MHRLGEPNQEDALRRDLSSTCTATALARHAAVVAGVSSLSMKLDPADLDALATFFARRFPGTQERVLLCLLVGLRAGRGQGDDLALWLEIVKEAYRRRRLLRLARAATEASPEEAEAWLARSDAELALGDTAAARRALNTAARLLQNPDADLKRRARIARAEGDRLGALAHLRHRLTLYPSDGEALWFYALTVMEPGLESHRPTFNADLDRAMARLHPEARPLDFVIAALHLVGRGGVETERLMTIGLARDCEPIEDASSKDNCVAWYMAMGGSAEDEALALIRGAVAAKPHRSDYLDTLAIVLLGRGELAEAAQASAAAARLAPDRFYHLWQTERLGALASNAALK